MTSLKGWKCQKCGSKESERCSKVINKFGKSKGKRRCVKCKWHNVSI